MNASVKTALLGVLIGGLILAVVGISAWALIRAQDTAQAQPGVVTTLAIDVDPDDDDDLCDYDEDGSAAAGGAGTGNCCDGTDNDADTGADYHDPECTQAALENDDRTVGTIDACIETTAGATVDFDVLLCAGAACTGPGAIPAVGLAKIKTFQYFMGFNSSVMRITAQSHTVVGINFIARALTSCDPPNYCWDVGEAAPDPPDTGSPPEANVHDVLVTDTVAGAEEGGILDPMVATMDGGVLGRYTVLIWSDGDDDGDGSVNEDPVDGIDNDLDGTELIGSANCDDGLDNDGDGKIDCADSDCQPDCDEDDVYGGAGIYGIGLNDSSTFTAAVNDPSPSTLWDVPGDGIDNDGDGAIDEDLMLDNTASPQQYGLIAVDTSCPEDADLEKLELSVNPYAYGVAGFLGIDNDEDGQVDEDGAGNFDFNGNTVLDACVGSAPDIFCEVQQQDVDDDGDTDVDEDPLDADVSVQTWYDIKESIINHGPMSPVPAYDIKEIDAPDPGDTDPHAQYPTDVSVDPEALDIIVVPAGVPIYLKEGCTPPKVYVQDGPFEGTIADLGGDPAVDCVAVDSVPDVLKELTVKKPVDLTLDVEELITQKFDLHCEGPSFHKFLIQNRVEPQDPSVPDPEPGNNALDMEMLVACLAEADLEVTNVTVTAPDSAVIDEPFDVTVGADVTNLGYGPVSADVTFDLDLTGTDCIKDPSDYHQALGVSLGSASLTSPTWSVTCSTQTTETLNGSVDVALNDPDPHISETILGNNSGTGSDSIDIVLAEADVQVKSWNIVEDELPNPGKQILITPPALATIHTEQVIHNIGPDGPAPTDDDRTVADVSGVCNVEPNIYSETIDLEVSIDVQRNDSWTVDWIDVDKPPFRCDLTFDKLLTVTGDFADLVSGNNAASDSIQVVLDSDGDGIPDDGDLSGDDTDMPCTPGETTFCDDNCEDDVNPGQEDIDEDGIGDACDLDNDEDGIPDDGDGSGTVGDNPCTGGETASCDDNCVLIANPGQEDIDEDGIGDVCELDVDCSNNPDPDVEPTITDVVMILQYIVGLADLSPDECPPPPGYLYGPRASAYIAYPDGVGTIIDAVMALQCRAGLHNIVCPDTGT